LLSGVWYSLGRETLPVLVAEEVVSASGESDVRAVQFETQLPAVRFR